MGIKKIGDYYLKVGEKLLKLAVVEWRKIGVYFQTGDGWNSWHYVVQDDIGKSFGKRELIEEYGLKVSVENEITNGIIEILLEMKEAFYKETGDDWTIISIILSDDGKLNIDYGYDDLDKAEMDSYDRIVKWRKEYLNI